MPRPNPKELSQYKIGDTVTVKPYTTAFGLPGLFAGMTGEIKVVKGYEKEDGKRVWIGELGIKFSSQPSLVWFHPRHLEP